MREMRGACLCGQVRYAASAEPTMVVVCHCKNCQREAGSAFGILVGIPNGAITIQGRLKTFDDIGESGQKVHRNFCPECGSPITSDVDARPELTFIKAGTLDDTSWLDPKVHLFCDSAQHWTPIPEGSQKFSKMPA